MPLGMGFGEVVVMLVFAGLFLLWPLALYECLVKESSEGNTKIVWALAILLAPFMGALLYLGVRRPQRIHELGQ